MFKSDFYELGSLNLFFKFHISKNFNSKFNLIVYERLKLNFKFKFKIGSKLDFWNLNLTVQAFRISSDHFCVHKQLNAQVNNEKRFNNRFDIFICHFNSQGCANKYWANDCLGFLNAWLSWPSRNWLFITEFWILVQTLNVKIFLHLFLFSVIRNLNFTNNHTQHFSNNRSRLRNQS